MSREDSTVTSPPGAEPSRPTPLDYMTCMATSGNGVRTTGWMITLPLPEMTVLIKTEIISIASHAADRGMNRLGFVAARRDFESCNQKEMSLPGFALVAM